MADIKKAEGSSKADEVKAAHAEQDKRNAEAMLRSNKGRPTPTQEELDRVALGESVELSPDGSDESGHELKQAKPTGAAPYQTRAATPKA